MTKASARRANTDTKSLKRKLDPAFALADQPSTRRAGAGPGLTGPQVGRIQGFDGSSGSPSLWARSLCKVLTQGLFDLARAQLQTQVQGYVSILNANCTCPNPDKTALRKAAHSLAELCKQGRRGLSTACAHLSRHKQGSAHPPRPTCLGSTPGPPVPPACLLQMRASIWLSVRAGLKPWCRFSTSTSQGLPTPVRHRE